MKKQKRYYTFEELKTELMKRPGFREEYEKERPKFELACQIIEKRIKRKMTQEELAKRAGTGQAVISRLEGMNARPSLSLLERIAAALETDITITIRGSA